MSLLDTHVWIWLADEGGPLSPEQLCLIDEHGERGLCVSAISLWEVAKLVEYGRLRLAISLEEWIEGALALPGIRLLELTPAVAIGSTRLRGTFHRDPADQIIVATARVFDIELLTHDEKIRQYPHVKTV